MIEDDIKALVEEHYKDPDAEILLLSNIGMKLTKQSLWPPANDKRTLFDATEDTPGVKPVRDDRARSYIPVVLEGDEPRAIKAIDAHKNRFVLRSYPRALLLAFTLEIAEGQIMSLKLGPKITYQGSPTLEEGTLRVDDDLRLPGLDIFDLPSLGDEDIETLATNIRAWCERHHVDQSTLVRTQARKPEPVAVAVPAASSSSALERLYAAQMPEVAKKLIVPIDIALALSRLP